MFVSQIIPPGTEVIVMPLVLELFPTSFFMYKTAIVGDVLQLIKDRSRKDNVL